MRLPLLAQRLLAERIRASAKAARQQSHEDLFPLLSAMRLEERRLLNAAPVAAATHAATSSSNTSAVVGHGSGSHASHQDVANLAQTMHQGPAYGQFTVNMSSSSLYGSGGATSGTAASSAKPGPQVGTSTAAPVASGSQTVSNAFTIAAPPVNALPPGPLATNENTALVIAGISVADASSGSSPIVSRFQVDNGTLTVDTSMPGTTVLPGGIVQLGNGAVVTGNGTNILQIVGTVDQINAAVAPGLTYTPGSSFDGADTLTMVTNDLGTNGGAPLETTSTVAIDVAEVNDTINMLPAGPLSTNEDTALVVSGISVSDVDSTSSPLVVRFEVDHGTLTIDTSMPGTTILPGGIVQLGNGAVVTGNGTNILQIVGTTAQINAALAQPAALTYTPAANFDGADTLTMVTDDPAANNGGGSVVSSVAINVAEVNDAINTLPAGPLSTNEDTALVVSGISVSDVDSTSSPLVVRFEADHGTLAIDTSMPGTTILPGGIVQLGNGAIVLGNGTSVLQIVGTTAQINAALAQPGSLTYLPDSDYVGPDTLTMVTDDPAASGRSGSVTSSVAINVAPVAPVITNLAITPNQILIANTATLTGNISDPGEAEAYTLTVNWGDGTAPQIVALPAGTTSFSLTHDFTDNVRGMPLQINTVQVSVVDDHPSVMGTASTTIAVQDVAPTLTNLTGTDVGSNGIATLTGTIAHPGTSPLSLVINWGDTAQVINNVPQGAFDITHFYSAAPNPANPTAPIPIHISVVDDDNLSASGDHTSAVPGLGPLAAIFFMPAPPTLPQIFVQSSGLGDYVAVQPNVLTFTTVQFDLRPPRRDASSTAEAAVVLRTIDVASGTERGVVVLPVDVLNNLPQLFSKLPDDHYRLYYNEQGTERLIMDVMVRRGKAIDPTDDSEGTQDRPPTSHMERIEGGEVDDHREAQQALEKAADAENGAGAHLDEVLEAPGDGSAMLEHLPAPLRVGSGQSEWPAVDPNADALVARSSPSKYRDLFAPAVAAIVASSAWTNGRWARHVDRELAKADAQRLTKSARLKRRLRRGTFP
jgi:hypothetical protein